MPSDSRWRSANKLRSVTPGDFVIWGKDHFMTMNVAADGAISAFDPQTGERYDSLDKIRARLGTERFSTWRASPLTEREEQ